MLGEEPSAGVRLERGKLQPAVGITVDEEVDGAAAEGAVAVEEDDPRWRNRRWIPLRAGGAPVGGPKCRPSSTRRRRPSLLML